LTKKKIRHSTRVNCIISQNDELRNFLSLKNFPVFIGCTDQDRDKDLFFDMNWSIGASSGLIQLKNLIDQKIIYSEYHSEAVGSVWKKHHEEFSQFITKYCDQRIIEMGGGANNLANLCSKSKKIKSWFNFELAKVGSNQIKYNKKVKYINKPINEKNIKKYAVKKTSFVHSHVLEHLYSPVETLQSLLKFKEIDKMIFSIPNLKMYLQNRYSNVINFEHTYLITEEVLKKMLNMMNFKIKKKKYFREHSIFIYAEKSASTKEYQMPNLKKYQVMYKKMINFYKHKTVKMNKIFLKKNQKKNFMFGAHVFSQFLINMGLKESKFNCVLDNSRNKQSKRLYGSMLKVQNPEIIRNISNPIVLANVGQYQTEIEKQLKMINSKVKIIKF
jgi:hypothetical protein